MTSAPSKNCKLTSLNTASSCPPWKKRRLNIATDLITRADEAKASVMAATREYKQAVAAIQAAKGEGLLEGNEYSQHVTAPAIELRFCGSPAPQGSKTLTRWGMKESSDRVAPWRTSIQYACRDQYKGPVIDSPVHVFVTFVLPRAKAHWSTKKGCEDQLKPSAPTHCTIGGDIDKQCRAVLDGLSATCGGCILKDDRLVTHLAAQKRYAEAGEPTGALVRVQIVR